MTIQLTNIVIYSHDKRQRVLSLKAGELNIITGASKSGKSSLIDIVDYCFCSDECNVPEGPIRRCVSWFGLGLKIRDGFAFIARKIPNRGKKSSESCYFEIGSEISTPDALSIMPNTNTEGLRSLLSEWSGIKENLHQPAEHHSRPAISANIRHALTFCFQQQDEIIRREQLFHKASDSFISMAIKDTLPYFLGAVGDEYLSIIEKLKHLKAQLRILERQIKELKSLRGEGTSKASSLLAQARAAGLSSSFAANYEETISLLKYINAHTIAEKAHKESEDPHLKEHDRLTLERDRLILEKKNLKNEIDAAKKYQQDERGFSREATEQRSRLESINIFDEECQENSCPLCTQSIENHGNIPSVIELKSELSIITDRLKDVAKFSPRMEKAILKKQSDLNKIDEHLRKNRSELEAISKASAKLKKLKEAANKGAYVLGRISLYLESLPDLPDSRNLELRAKNIISQINLLEEEVSDEQILEKLNSISSILGAQMSEWARNLELEHSEHPLRLDFKKLTIISDTANGPVPMKRMGSGENWVGYHLISHIALHRWFIQQSRPVPGFLFLDQPSQVYFPPERDIVGAIEEIDEEDREAVKNMFKFIFDSVPASKKLQIIVTEHADLNEDWYQGSVAERWRSGLKLVPPDWPSE
ncbi:DUF3732 domain-containing protein [Pseudobacteriovorax antillogorgiicola]|uniref:DUF3732 domain-containing protein n=1 Tax=Pseudobacteriovorax antillogorgiicola TaxID=1513793 RepID=A0A1Y6CL59_9BACT|nr:DUF3732 domain-containing protein [Pseudobacteriovorax antillogorgiicola]TCS45662.1 uncharacterized protein DUF3732 [Pseudobacteriovorax antillogorgiicola]SMF72975.1 Protein of unknown function [Pseudobacteriovorax antillogorgiicola]